MIRFDRPAYTLACAMALTGCGAGPLPLADQSSTSRVHAAEWTDVGWSDCKLTRVEKQGQDMSVQADDGAGTLYVMVDAKTRIYRAKGKQGPLLAFSALRKGQAVRIKLIRTDVDAYLATAIEIQPD